MEGGGGQEARESPVFGDRATVSDCVREIYRLEARQPTWMVSAETRSSAFCPIVTRYVRLFQAEKTHHGPGGHSPWLAPRGYRGKTGVAGLTPATEHFARAFRESHAASSRSLRTGGSTRE